MTVNKPQNSTIIDIISEGYRAINRRPLIILIPLMLNLCMWCGVQVSLHPLIDAAVTFVQEAPQPAISENQAELTAQYDQFRSAGQWNMWQSMAVLNFIPTLTIYSMGGDNAENQVIAAPPNMLVSIFLASLSLPYPVPQLLNPQLATFEINGLPLLLAAFIGINMVLLPASAVFLTRLAVAVRQDQPHGMMWLQQAKKASLSLLAYVGIAYGLGFALGIPFLFFTGVLLAVSPPLGGLVIGFLIVIIFWVSIYVGFTPEAIAVSGIGPLHAIRASFTIVQRDFWSTLLFLALIFLITAGTGLIWNAFATSSVGVIAAAIGSAYIGSGLWAARMAFYREKLQRWHSTIPVPHPSPQ
ncbi:MAG: hypothetical protein GFH27_549303n73 [Chloroflexi bacterium AL-W]|nr:hypothetical protein [Chloroflexi bacterium AL-N1]NOK67958.1 hypothetical protein [Chloroflexi bacterium AL-N10]NOK73298.1 hypothetical protein [Chloroflexi bacterium AL-N5]NOK83212.1 hypothetical protein [Chloroflexi bacterium AL-W]NOK87629.1 hypothetical protein [Chloroflexi bacterium AL-N15]